VPWCRQSVGAGIEHLHAGDHVLDAGLAGACHHTDERARQSGEHGIDEGGNGSDDIQDVFGGHFGLGHSRPRRRMMTDPPPGTVPVPEPSAFAFCLHQNLKSLLRSLGRCLRGTRLL
jgi:hypothetical protein